MVKSHADRGDMLPFRKFHSEHLGHNAHVNDFGVEGISLKDWVERLDKWQAREARKERILNFFGLPSGRQKRWQNRNR